MNIKRSTFEGKVKEWVNITGHVGSVLFMRIDFLNQQANWYYSSNIRTEKFVVPL